MALKVVQLGSASGRGVRGPARIAVPLGPRGRFSGVGDIQSPRRPPRPIVGPNSFRGLGETIMLLEGLGAETIHTHTAATPAFSTLRAGQCVAAYASTKAYSFQCAEGTCWMDKQGCVHRGALPPDVAAQNPQTVVLQRPFPMTLEQFKAQEPANFTLWTNKTKNRSPAAFSPANLVYAGLVPFRIVEAGGNKYGSYYSAPKKVRRDERILPDPLEAAWEKLKEIVGGLLCKAVSNPALIQTAVAATGYGADPRAQAVGTTIAERLARAGCSKTPAGGGSGAGSAQEKKSFLPIVAVAGGLTVAALLLF